jgi:hypothetical protein
MSRYGIDQLECAAVVLDEAMFRQVWGRVSVSLSQPGSRRETGTIDMRNALEQGLYLTRDPVLLRVWSRDQAPPDDIRRYF